MKKIFIVFFVCTSLIGCKKETKTQVETMVEEDVKEDDGLTLLQGEFLYLADAAVLQTHREIYGVVLDDKMHELDKMVRPYKIEDTDMVPVTIRGKIIQKPENEEGWNYRVEIKEILVVKEPERADNSIIKIEN